MRPSKTIIAAVGFLLILYLINCAGVKARGTGTLSLRYASLFVDNKQSIESFRKLPKWPADSVKAQVMYKICLSMFAKFRSELDRSKRDCRYTIVDNTEMADVSLYPSFPSAILNGDTLAVIFELKIADRRSGNIEFVKQNITAVINAKDKNVFGSDYYYLYGRLLMVINKNFKTDSIVSSLCGGSNE